MEFKRTRTGRFVQGTGAERYTTMTARPHDADQSTPAAVRAAWQAAVAAGNAEALASLLADDYEVWAHAAPVIRGPAAAVDAMRGAMAQFRIDQRFEPMETVIAGEWAFERGIERMTATPIGGGPERTMSQRALLILRRGSDGRWRYARGMTNGMPATTTSTTT